MSVQTYKPLYSAREAAEILWLQLKDIDLRLT